MSTSIYPNQCSTFLHNNMTTSKSTKNGTVIRKSITVPLMRSTSNPQISPSSSRSTSSSSSDALLADRSDTKYQLRRKHNSSHLKSHPNFMSNRIGRRTPSDSALTKIPSNLRSSNPWDTLRSPTRHKSSVFALTTTNPPILSPTHVASHNHESDSMPISSHSKARPFQPMSTQYSHTLTPRFRSKSLVSTDPKSPYYVSPNHLNQSTIPRDVSRGNRFQTDSNRFRQPNFVTNFHVVPTMQPMLGYPPYRRSSEAILAPGAAIPWNNQELRSPPRSFMPGNGDIPGINKTFTLNDPIFRTIGQHYYPEGGWGWIITVCASLCLFITSALFPASSFLIVDIVRTFKPEEGILAAVLIGSFSTMVTLIFSPIIFALGRRKSTRLTAVVGGLVTALGCLFTSFATQLHQLTISYGIFVGIGVAMIRDTSVIMIGQYFKKRREFVEIFVMGGNGLGIAIMPVFLSLCIRSQNWRTGLQSLALVASINFFIGVLYRSASLYHPQRRAILHLKSLQRKSRLKESRDKCLNGSGASSSNEKPPYFDFTILKSRTIRILLSATCISHFGLTTPLFLMVYHGERTGLSYSSLLGLQTFLGLGMILGTVAFGWIVVKNNVDCMIARQYLCQASSFMISASILAFTTLNDYSGYLLFTWIYGFFLGGYLYSLKMFVYEKVRARNFNRAWGYVQSIQSIPTLVGVPISGFLSEYYGNKCGYFLSSFCTALGSIILFLIDNHRKTFDDRNRLSSSSGCHYHQPAMSNGMDPILGSMHFTGNGMFTEPPLVSTKPRVVSNGVPPPKIDLCHLLDIPHEPRSSAEFDPKNDLRSSSLFSSPMAGGHVNGELTCISEEVFMENFLGDYELGSCITPCDRDEKYMMLSEFENNFETCHGNIMSEDTAALLKMSRQRNIFNPTRPKPETHLRECPLRERSSMKRPPISTFSPNIKKRRASFPVLERLRYEEGEPIYGAKMTDNEYEIEPGTEIGGILDNDDAERCLGCLRIVQQHVQMEKMEQNQKETLVEPYAESPKMSSSHTDENDDDQANRPSTSSQNETSKNEQSDD
ncbi:uncharacterized protein LOC141858629 [Brevipalpus obovatus]|uniref:uncharacterized protein LOC141858629 n=1 Tax=Brevipalpus obovatus TaxID=246614 RepID=UPI003D9E95FB